MSTSPLPSQHSVGAFPVPASVVSDADRATAVTSSSPAVREALPQDMSPLEKLLATVPFKESDDPLRGVKTEVRGGTIQPIMMTAANELAMHWRYAKNNRKLRISSVIRAQHRIARKMWMDNGTARIFDKDGYALNGHHTHNAAIMALAENPTLTYPVNFVWGIETAAQATIDTNVGRTPTDHVKHLGLEFNNPGAVADAAKFIHRIYDNIPSKGRGTTALSPRVLENDEVEGVVFKYLDKLIAADSFVSTLKLKSGVRASLLIVLHVWGASNPKTLEFISQVATGLNLAPNSASAQLHNVLTSPKKSSKKTRINTSQITALALVMLKRFLAGEDVEKLGPYPKSYPTL